MINPLIIKTLTPVGLPIYFTSRGENSGPCIVFNIVESPLSHSDDKEDITEYRILLNVLVDSENYVDIITKVKKVMYDAEFQKLIIPSAIFDDTLGLFNQPLEYVTIK